MKNLTSLGLRILNHWQTHRPRMVRELERQNRLHQTLLETQERVSDLIHEMVCVKKMTHQAAWELAMEEWALTGEESPPRKSSSRTSRRSQPRRRRGTSA